MDPLGLPKSQLSIFPSSHWAIVEQRNWPRKKMFPSLWQDSIQKTRKLPASSMYVHSSFNDSSSSNSAHSVSSFSYSAHSVSSFSYSSRVWPRVASNMLESEMLWTGWFLCEFVWCKVQRCQISDLMHTWGKHGLWSSTSDFFSCNSVWFRKENPLVNRRSFKHSCLWDPYWGKSFLKGNVAAGVFGTAVEPRPGKGFWKSLGATWNLGLKIDLIYSRNQSFDQNCINFYDIKATIFPISNIHWVRSGGAVALGCHPCPFEWFGSRNTLEKITFTIDSWVVMELCFDKFTTTWPKSCDVFSFKMSSTLVEPQSGILTNPDLYTNNKYTV